MPPPTIDLESYKSQILTWFQQENLTIPVIVAKLQAQGVNVHHRTVQRRCTQWNSHKRIRTHDTPELRRRVVHLFAVEKLTDAQMLSTLRREGFEVQPKALQRLRKRLGCKRGPGIFKSREELEQRMQEQPLEERFIPDVVDSSSSGSPLRSAPPSHKRTKSVSTQCALLKDDHLPASTLIVQRPAPHPSEPPTLLPTILFISLDEMLQNYSTCASLLSALHSHAYLLCAEKTLTALEALTSASLKIHGVILADPTVAHGKKQAELRQKLVDYVDSGGTVICAGIFARLMAPKDCNAFFQQTWKLPWAFSRDSYYLNAMRGQGLSGMELPESYETKANSLKGVADEDRVYTRRFATDGGEAHVVLTRIGGGRLGYVGDVNPVAAATSIVLAMLGLG